jgi:hypothetical protein
MNQVPDSPYRRSVLTSTGLLVLALCFLAATSQAGTITIEGLIKQSIADGTGPASNNFALNSIADLSPYILTLSFAGSIAAPGTFHPDSLSFDVASAPADESAFSSITLTVTLNAGFDEFSLLGCLTSGSACDQGNYLTANFKVPTASLLLQNVVTTELDQPHPMDLLEDDGITDIQGSITRYSNTGSAPVPEPAAAGLIGAALGLMWLVGRRKRRIDFTR